MMTSRRDQILAASMNAYVLTDTTIKRLEDALAMLKRARGYNHAGSRMIEQSFYPAATDSQQGYPDAA